MRTADPAATRLGQRDNQVSPITSSPTQTLAGAVRVPGDKSISHRALMLSASAVGETVISGLLEGADVRATGTALVALGAGISQSEDGTCRVLGRGVGGLHEPDTVLDLGNSGTGARLLAGLLATHPFHAMLTGDASLRNRPMGRVIAPLERMGARFAARDGGLLPMTIRGTADPVPVEYTLPVPSAQVKSAVLLAGLNTPGRTTVVEPARTRDHTERMLAAFGAELEIEPVEDGGQRVALTGQPELAGMRISVPADPSSAAFPTVAALIAPSGAVDLPGVGVNPLRTGLFETLSEMGAAISVTNAREEHGEPVADLSIRSSALSGVRVPAERAPRMIDEYPALAVAAAYAKGETRLEGLAELRVKESDRLTAIAEGLHRCGVRVDLGEDFLTIEGCGGPPPGPDAGDAVAARDDHRIAMAFLTLGVASQRPVTVDDGRMIETSFPGFTGLMTELGARIA